MKKLFLLMITATACVFSQPADAKIWRVNKVSDYAAGSSTSYGGNLGGTLGTPVFKEINDAVAYNAVQNGDTLHVEAYNGTYNNAAVTKRLVIIGAGYFLNENQKVANTVDQPQIFTVNFNTGSSGSALLGMNVSGSTASSAGVNINVSNILIKRCRISNDIDIASGLNNITIVQNFFAGSSTSVSAIYSNSASSYVPPTTLVFNNNITQKVLVLRDEFSFLQCDNNTFDCPIVSGGSSIKLNAASFRNNILMTPNATVNINNGSGSNVTHNYSASAAGQFGTANNNLMIPAGLFVTTGTSDGKYQLNPGISAPGLDGSDRGAFGGSAASSRYAASGVAPIPVIYDIQSPGLSSPTGGLPVTIKARAVK